MTSLSVESMLYVIGLLVIILSIAISVIITKNRVNLDLGKIATVVIVVVFISEIFGFFLFNKNGSFYGLIAMCGSIGALTLSLSTNSNHSIKTPFHGKGLQLGFIGDLLIGGVSGIVAVALVSVLFKESLELGNVHKALIAGNLVNGKAYFGDDLIHIFAISLIGGFGGMRFLDGVKSIALKKIEEQIKQTNSSIDQKDRSIQVNFKLQEADSFLNKEAFQDALDSLDSALTLEKSPVIYGKKAYIYREKALKEKTDQLIKRSIEQALFEIDRALSMDKELESLPKHRVSVYYWNRACYKNLLNKTSKDIEADLLSSFSFDPFTIEELESEADLSSIKWQEETDQYTLIRAKLSI